MDTETSDSSAQEQSDQGSLFLGLVLCWLLNMAHLGVAYLLFVSGDRTLPAVLLLVGAIGLLQIGYVAPIWYLLRYRGRRRMATGVAIAAAITLLFNAGFWMVLYANGS